MSGTGDTPGRCQRFAIVTGGAGGLGRFLTRRLCGQGVHVVVGDIDAIAGRRLVDTIEDEGGRATFVNTDASDANGVRSLVLQAAELGELEVLINNARLASWPAVSDTNRWFQSLDPNLRMPMLATQLCLPLMEAGGGGAVVNVASSGGLEPVGYRSPEYAAAKAGPIRFITAVRDAALRSKVRVSCVVPR